MDNENRYIIFITLCNEETNLSEDWLLHLDGLYTQNLNDVWTFSDEDKIQMDTLIREKIITDAIEQYPTDRLYFIGRLTPFNRRGYEIWNTVSSTPIIMDALDNGILKLVRSS